MPRTTLVTGASGFVGSNLVPLLAARGDRLRLLVRDPTFVSPHGETWPGDLDDEASLQRALRGVDEVVHLAALVSFMRRDAALAQRVNVDGTRRLASLARQAGVRRFLHMSSVAAVGCSERPAVLDEQTAYNLAPLRIAYCDTKRGAELAVLEEASRGLDAVIVNPSSMFGPGDRRKARDSLLDAAVRGRVPFCPPGGASFADVRDVARGSLAALERGRTGERYILAGENLTGQQLLAVVFGAIDKAPPKHTLARPLARLLAGAAGLAERVVPLRPPLTAEILRMATRYFWFSSAKAQRELGYTSAPVIDAVRATYRWLAECGAIAAHELPVALRPAEKRPPA